MSILERVKLSLRIVTDDFDGELTALISACQADLGIAGVVVPSTLTDIINLAIVTYCKMHFGAPEEYDRLKASYDEQKAQLSMAFSKGYAEAY